MAHRSAAAATAGPAAAPPAPAAPPPENEAARGLRPGHRLRDPVSDDAAYRLRVGLQAATSSSPSIRTATTRTATPFFVLRPILAGNFFKEWIHFWTSFEFASNPPYLLDSYVEIARSKSSGCASASSGRRFDRHEYFGPQEILFPEWAPVSEYFWTGRDKGVTAMGTIAGQLEYWAGVYSGTPLRQFNALPGNYVLEGRVTWSPMGPVGADRVPVHRVRRAAAVPRVGDAAGLQRQDPERDRELQPVDVPLRGDGDRARRPRTAPAAPTSGSRARASSSSPRRSSATRAPDRRVVHVGRRLGPGGRDAPRSQTWTSRRASTGSTPAPISATTSSIRSRGSSPGTSSHSQTWSLKLRYAYGHQNSPGMAALGSVPLVISTPGEHPDRDHPGQSRLLTGARCSSSCSSSAISPWSW